MSVARSSLYAEPFGKPADEATGAKTQAIADEFGHGYRRVDAGLRCLGQYDVELARLATSCRLEGHGIEKCL